MCSANTYLYVPPRRYVFSGAEAYGRLIEDDDDNSNSSLDSADNDSNDGECSDTGLPAGDIDTDGPGTSADYLPTPPELTHLDSSSGSLDP